MLLTYLMISIMQKELDLFKDTIYGTPVGSGLKRILGLPCGIPKTSISSRKSTVCTKCTDFAKPAKEALKP